MVKVGITVAHARRFEALARPTGRPVGIEQIAEGPSVIFLGKRDWARSLIR